MPHADRQAPCVVPLGCNIAPVDFLCPGPHSRMDNAAAGGWAGAAGGVGKKAATHDERARGLRLTLANNGAAHCLNAGPAGPSRVHQPNCTGQAYLYKPDPTEED